MTSRGLSRYQHSTENFCFGKKCIRFPILRENCQRLQYYPYKTATHIFNWAHVNLSWFHFSILQTPFIHFKISFCCVSNKILTLAIIPELKLIFKIWASQIFMFRSKTHSSPRRFWWKYEVNVFIIHHYLSMSHRPGLLSIVMF